MKSEYYNAKTFPLLLHPLKRKINCCSWYSYSCHVCLLQYYRPIT